MASFSPPTFSFSGEQLLEMTSDYKLDSDRQQPNDHSSNDHSSNGPQSTDRPSIPVTLPDVTDAKAFKTLETPRTEAGTPTETVIKVKAPERISNAILPVMGLRICLGYCVMFVHNFRGALKAWDSRDHLPGRAAVSMFFLMAGYFTYLSLATATRMPKDATLGLKFYLTGRRWVVFWANRILPIIFAEMLVWVICIYEGVRWFPWAQLVDFNGNPFTNIWHVGPNTPITGWKPNGAVWYLSVQILFWIISPPIMTLIRRFVNFYGAILLLFAVTAWDVSWYAHWPQGIKGKVPQDAAYNTPITWIGKHLQGLLVARIVFTQRERVVAKTAETGVTFRDWKMKTSRQLMSSGIVETCFVAMVLLYAYLPDYKKAERIFFFEGCYFLHPTLIPALCVWGLFNVPLFSIVSRMLGSRWACKVAPGATNLLVYVFHGPFLRNIHTNGFTHVGIVAALIMLWLLATNLDRYVQGPFTSLIARVFKK